MIKGGTGGANTKTGAFFEGKVDFVAFLNGLKGYKCKLNPNSKGKSYWYDIYFNNDFVASSFKNMLYIIILKYKGLIGKIFFQRGCCQMMLFM
jgi:hypothetical protein